MNNLQDRVEREKKWHDERFNEHARSTKTSKFYQPLEYWYIDYDSHFFDTNSDIVLEVGAGLESVALKASLFFRRLDDIFLNKFRLGRYLAWACLIHK